MPAKKATPRKRLTKGNEHPSTLERNARTVDPMSAGLGKGASSLQPLSSEQLTVDYKTGVIMAITMPLALIFFWKVTLPVTWFVMKTALGEQLVIKLNYFKQGK